MPNSQTPKPEIVAALRAEMRQLGLDAFILPRFDQHQGEYVAPHDMRLAFVTGFTGSAGMAIVTQEDVAIFVDGRYTVQLGNQCPVGVFSHHHLFDSPPENWLEKTAATGWKIGFDAMHIPPSWYDRFKGVCANAGATLQATAANPVDVIWDDQPPAPMAPVSPFPTQFAGVDSQQKCADLLAYLKQTEADFLLDTQPDNIAWFLNLRGGDVDFNPMPQSFVLVAATGEVVWFVAPEKVDQSVLDCLPAQVEALPISLFRETLGARVSAGQKVVLDPDFSPVAARLLLEAKGAKIIEERGVITLTKARKNATELEGMRACHIEDGVAWTEFCAWLAAAVPARAHSGNPVHEREAEEKILEFRRARPGFLGESFNTISAAAGNAAMCHYATTPDNSAAILLENTFLLDSGGQYINGTTDATRSFSFAAPRPAGYDEAYTAVFKALYTLATLRFPKGTQGHHIDAICRRPLWDLGLDYDHGTGHGVGHQLSVHEQPQRIGKPYSPVDLAAGMVLSIEPGYYAANQFGIRIENLFEVVAEEDGFLSFRNLTFAPIQTDMINVDALTSQEKAWLNSYQSEIMSKIGPMLSAEAAAWLKETSTLL